MTASNDSTDPVKKALLDLMSSYDDDASDEQNDRAVETAFARLREADAVSATYDDETDTVTVDITPLLSAFGYITHLLSVVAADKFGISREALIFSMREVIEGH